MLTKIYPFLTSKLYWLVLLVFGIAMEVAALFYQYVLEYYPCVLCIHVRIIVVGIIIISILGFLFHAQKKTSLILHLLMTALFVSLFERSYQLLGVERGFVTGECSMNSGLPSWLSVDQWFPLVFKIWEPCGYTPVLLFGITMAEALFVSSAILVLISTFLTVTTFTHRSHN